MPLKSRKSPYMFILEQTAVIHLILLAEFGIVALGVGASGLFASAAPVRSIASEASIGEFLLGSKRQGIGVVPKN